MELVKSTRC